MRVMSRKRGIRKPTDLPDAGELTVAGQSMLVEETKSMENNRRLKEQEGHRQYAKVNQRERHDNQQSAGNQLTSGPKEHPLLGQSQRFDGIDNNLNPAPPLNDGARMEYDNAQREQQAEREHRLQLGQKLGHKNTPKPSPF